MSSESWNAHAYPLQQVTITTEQNNMQVVLSRTLLSD